ncbi:MAG: hypothetical protein C0467_17455 [Planctomycetaceae bacterium]|nr:hypothetical protein [Planctomycetaceae bacterium]
MGKDVIFENDGSLHLLEDPVQAARHPPATAKIRRRVVAKHFAGPIDTLYERASGGASLSILRMVRARPIGDQQKLLGSSSGDFSKDLGRGIGAIEEEKRHRG